MEIVARITAWKHSSCIPKKNGRFRKYKDNLNLGLSRDPE